MRHRFQSSLCRCRPDHLLSDVRTQTHRIMKCLSLTTVLSAYSFACNHKTVYAYLGATTFPCTSHWPAEGLTTTITLTYTQLGPWAQSVASYTVTRASDSSTVTFTTWGWFTTTEVVSDGGTLYAMAVAISPPVSAISPCGLTQGGC